MKINPFSGSTSNTSQEPGVEAADAGRAFDRVMAQQPGSSLTIAPGERPPTEKPRDWCGTPAPRPRKPRPPKAPRPEPVRPPKDGPIATTMAIGEEGPPIADIPLPKPPLPTPVPIEPGPGGPIWPIKPPYEVSTMALGEEGPPLTSDFGGNTGMKSVRGPFLIEVRASQTADNAVKSSPGADRDDT